MRSAVRAYAWPRRATRAEWPVPPDQTQKRHGFNKPWRFSGVGKVGKLWRRRRLRHCSRACRCAMAFARVMRAARNVISRASRLLQTHVLPVFRASVQRIGCNVIHMGSRVRPYRRLAAATELRRHRRDRRRAAALRRGRGRGYSSRRRSVLGGGLIATAAATCRQKRSNENRREDPNRP